MNRLTLLYLSLFYFLSALPGMLAGQHISTGITGGIVNSRVGFDPSVEQKYFQGFSSGLVFMYEKPREPGFQAEVIFIRRGWNAGSDSLGQYSRSVDYLSIPILTHWHAGGKRVRWFLNTGPQIGWVLGDRLEKESQPSGSYSFSGRKIYSDWELGINAGTGLQLTLGKKIRAGLEVRATQNLSSIFSSGPQGLFFSSKFFSVCGLFHLGFIWEKKSVDFIK